MDIQSYLTRAKITQAAFAEKIGRHPSTVSRILNGELPGWEVMARIFEATRGKVRPNDFAPFLAVKGRDGA